MMAKRAGAHDGSKSEVVLEYMASHPGATAKEIVRSLNRAGVKVSQSLVAKIKSRSGGQPKSSRASAPRASSNGSGETSKAERIRQVAQSMAQPVRPRDVIATLAAEGIVVSSAQVSMTLRSMGMRKRRRGRRAGAATSVGRSAVSASASVSLSLESLLAAKKLVTQLGSVEAAKSAVDALAKLQ